MKNQVMAVTMIVLAVIVVGCITKVETPRARIVTCGRDPNKIIKSIEESPSLTKPVVPNANAYGALVTAGDGNPGTLATIQEVAKANVGAVVTNSKIRQTTRQVIDLQRGAICNWKDQAYSIKMIDETGCTVATTVSGPGAISFIEVPPGFYVVQVIDSSGRIIGQVDRMINSCHFDKKVTDPANEQCVLADWGIDIESR